MSTGIHFRHYRTDEEPAVAAMMYALNREDPEEGPLDDTKIGALFAAAPKRAPVELFVAVDGESVIGYCIFVRSFSVEFNGPLGEIDEIFVAPGHRGRGIGTAFIHFLEDHARNLGCRGFHLVATSGNEAAQRLYERIGFTPLPRVSFFKPL